MRNLRRLSLVVVIVAFSIAALLGIIALLVGDFGDTQAKVLLTTVTVGLESLAVLCYITPRQPRFVELGIAGFVVSLVPFVLAITLTWFEQLHNDIVTDIFLTTLVVAGTLAQVCLMAGLTASLQGRTRWVLIGTIAAAALMAALLIWLILTTRMVPSDFWRFFGVVAILDALGTVVLIALGLSKRRHQDEEGSVPEPTFDLRESDRERFADMAAETGADPQELLNAAVEKYFREIVLR